MVGYAGSDAVGTASRTDEVLACYRRCVGNQDADMAKLASGCLGGDGIVRRRLKCGPRARMFSWTPPQAPRAKSSRLRD